MRVLFITLTNIGDAILSTVLLDRILADHPDATVDVVVGKGPASLFEGLPNLGKLIPVVKKKRHGHYIDIWKQLRGEKYDIIVDLRTPLLGRLLNGKKKIIFKHNMKEHKAVQMAKLWPMKEERPYQQRLDVRPEVYEKVKADIAALGTDPIISIAPTANWIGKQWPQKNFAKLCEEISKWPGYEKVRFAIFGVENERHTVADFVSYIPDSKRIDLIGKTSLPESYVWLKHSSLFIGNDSGMAHMAAAADVPTVTIFGPTWPHVYSPVSRIGTTVIAPEVKEANFEPVSPKKPITGATVEMVLEGVKKVITMKQQANEEEVRHAS